VFATLDGSVVAGQSEPRLAPGCHRAEPAPVMLHAEAHACSALIAVGVDVLTVSRRLVHGTPAFTLSVWHLFDNTDAAAARAIEAAFAGA